MNVKVFKNYRVQNKFRIWFSILPILIIISRWVGGPVGRWAGGQVISGLWVGESVVDGSMVGGFHKTRFFLL